MYLIRSMENVAPTTQFQYFQNWIDYGKQLKLENGLRIGNIISISIEQIKSSTKCTNNI